MNFINQYLAELPEATRHLLYGNFGSVMHAVMFAVLIVLIWRMSLGKKNSICMLLSYYAAFFACTTACSVLGNLTNNLIPKINLGVGFLFFLFVLVLLLRLLKEPIRQCLDTAVPLFIFGRSIGIIGCLFPGCCHGFPAVWGIYSHNAGTTVVPTVPFDILLSLAIVVYLLLSRKKQPAAGMIAAKGMMLFGILRYVIDVLRDNNKLFLMVTTEGICGIIYVLTGMFLLYAIDKKSKITSAKAENAQTNLS